MVRLFMLISVLCLLYYNWPTLEKWLSEFDYEKGIHFIHSEINEMKENEEVFSQLNNLYNEFQHLMKGLGVNIDEIPLTLEKQSSRKEVKIDLKTPTKQKFSIYNVEIGQRKASIESHLGKAKRASLNEYQSNWYAYHENYQHFLMVIYDQNHQAAGLFTNQDLIASTTGIKQGSTKEYVRSQLGKPITSIQKGFRIYQFQGENDYDIYLIDNVYVTIFYDKHEGYTVTAMQMIRKDVEGMKTEFYTKANSALKEGFEYQLFDLTNATRIYHNLPILTWDQHVRETARKHSTDMATNHYFDHTNLEGQSPFDRMKEDHVAFHLAGENLAYGQFSSIFAHEGLMNSLGHRENILRKDFEYLGVGVAFNDESQPYYTQNFYAN